MQRQSNYKYADALETEEQRLLCIYVENAKALYSFAERDRRSGSPITTPKPLRVRLARRRGVIISLETRLVRFKIP